MTREQIWAPWRLCYIQGEKNKPPQQTGQLDLLPGADPGCFICIGVADPADRDHGVVHRGQHCITIVNRYPYNNGHLLIAPRRHLSRLDQLSPDEHAELAQALTRMIGLLEKVLHPQGFNVGLNLGPAAGAGLPDHLHWHVVPRWIGDTNFMPVLAGVNVIAQSLDALWEALTEAEGRGL